MSEKTENGVWLSKAGSESNPIVIICDDTKEKEETIIERFMSSFCANVHFKECENEECGALIPKHMTMCKPCWMRDNDIQED